MEELNLSFEIKSIDEDEPGSFTGFASVYGNEDLHGDVVEKGAFDRTLKHNDKVTLLWQHDPREPVGSGTLRDTEKGLVIEGSLNLDIELGKRAHSHLKREEIKGLSIGYDALEVDWKEDTRILKEIRLWEVSLVTFPANPKAGVTNVKSALPFQDLDFVSDDHSWDEDGAVSRLDKYFSDSSDREYKKAFLWFAGGDPKDIDNYSLPIADVVDGELKAVPEAIEIAANSLRDVDVDVNIPDNEKTRVTSHLNRYFDKMGLESPFKSSSVIMSDPKYERLLRKLISQTSLKNVDARSSNDSDSLTDSDVVLLNSAIHELKRLLETVDFDNKDAGEFDTKALSEARTPTFEGTESSSWGDVGLTWGDFWAGYVNNTDADGDPGDPPSWDEAPETAKSWVANRTLVGEASASTFDEARQFPVVNPSTDNLNEGGLDAANSRAPQSDLPSGTQESIQSKAVNLLEEHFDREIEESSAGEPEEGKNDIDDVIGSVEDWLEDRETKEESSANYPDDLFELIDNELENKEDVLEDERFDWVREKTTPDVGTFKDISDKLEISMTDLVISTFESGFVIEDEELEELGFEFDSEEGKDGPSPDDTKDNDSETLHSLLDDVEKFVHERVEGD